MSHDEARIESIANAILAGGQEHINKFLVIAALKNEEQTAEIKNALEDQKKKCEIMHGATPSIRPHITASAIAASLIAIIESVKMFYTQK